MNETEKDILEGLEEALELARLYGSTPSLVEAADEVKRKIYQQFALGRLKADVMEAERMLEMSPDDDYAGKISFENRKQELERQIKRTEDLINENTE